MVQAASAKNLVGTGLGFPTCFPLEVFWGASGEVSKISVPGKSQTLLLRNLVLTRCTAVELSGAIARLDF